jgi:hypothetical protein
LIRLPHNLLISLSRYPAIAYALSLLPVDFCGAETMILMSYDEDSICFDHGTLAWKHS